MATDSSKFPLPSERASPTALGPNRSGLQWAATLRGQTGDAVLVQLVRLLARQAARELAERRPEGDCRTGSSPRLPDKQR